MQKDLREVLGTERRLDFLAALPESAQDQLSKDILAARRRQKKALEEAVDHGLRMVPALLRGPIKKILF
jgi:hypothetical protein